MENPAIKKEKSSDLLNDDTKPETVLSEDQENVTRARARMLREIDNSQIVLGKQQTSKNKESVRTRDLLQIPPHIITDITVFPAGRSEGFTKKTIKEMLSKKWYGYSSDARLSENYIEGPEAQDGEIRMSVSVTLRRISETVKEGGYSFAFSIYRSGRWLPIADIGTNAIND